MNNTEKHSLIEHIIENISKSINKNSEDIIKAYETLHDEGGVPITLKATLRGNMEEIKTTYSLSFPKDKVKISYKTTFNVKQGELFDEDLPPGPNLTASEIKSREKALTNKTPPDPEGTEDYPGVKVKVGKEAEISVATIDKEDDVSWFSEIKLPKGLENYAGAYESEENFATKEAATLAGLNHSLGLINKAIDKKVAPQSKKGTMTKIKKGLEEIITGLEAGTYQIKEGAAPVAVH